MNKLVNRVKSRLLVLQNNPFVEKNAVHRKYGSKRRSSPIKNEKPTFFMPRCFNRPLDN